MKTELFHICFQIYYFSFFKSSTEILVTYNESTGVLLALIDYYRYHTNNPAILSWLLVMVNPFKPFLGICYYFFLGYMCLTGEPLKSYGSSGIHCYSCHCVTGKSKCCYIWYFSGFGPCFSSVTYKFM